MPWTTPPARAAACRWSRRRTRRRGTAGSAAPSRRAGWWSGAACRHRREVGRQEGVGQLAGDDGLRHHAAGGGAESAAASGSGSSSGFGLDARRPAACRSSGRPPTADTTAPSASSASSEVSRAAVLARIVAMPSSRVSMRGPLGLGRGGVALDPGAFLAHQQGDDLVRRAAVGPTLPRCAAASTWRTVLARTGMMPSSSWRADDAGRAAWCAARRLGAKIAVPSGSFYSVGHGVQPTSARGPPCSRRRGRGAGSTASGPERTRAKDQAWPPCR